MKAGKVTQTVYKRSVFKQLHKCNADMLLQPSQEEVCFGIPAGEGEQTLAAQVSLYGNEKDLCVFAMAKAANGLAARGGKACGVSLQILLPEFAYESRLKAMMELAKEAAEEQGLRILQSDVQIVPGIQTTIVNATCLGTVEDKILTYNKVAAGQDIVLMKKIGFEGTLRVKREGEDSLSKRFIPGFLGKLESEYQEIFSHKEMELAASQEVSAMHVIADGGILAALWELADQAEMGLQVDMRKIAVRQETIEVCEHFHLNPYQLTSGGAVLLVTANGDELVEALKAQEIDAVVIGHMVEGNDRVLMNGSEKRYLDRPAQDEFARFFAEQQEEKKSC